MSFDLKRVLKVMLFASNGPLSVKDIQTAISRFHEQAMGLPLQGEEPASVEGPTDGAAAIHPPPRSIDVELEKERSFIT